MKIIRLLYCLNLVIFVMSCTYHEKQEEVKRHLSVEESIELNKHALNKYSKIIESEISKKGWKMAQTETGLWYEIYKKGAGRKTETGDRISIIYNLELLNGTRLNSSDSLSIMEFVIGKGGVETGLEEGVLLLNEGDKARFVIPPHLAHGATGDGERIPGFAVLIYDIELSDIDEKFKK